MSKVVTDKDLAGKTLAEQHELMRASLTPEELAKEKPDREQAALAAVAQTHHQVWATLTAVIAERDALRTERDALLEATKSRGKVKA